MAFLKKIFLFLLLSILTACEETFTPGMPHAAVLCVNSLVTAGEPIEVSVSKSRLYTDTSDDSGVKDATVNIYANGQLQLASYIPKEGDEIRIVAQSKSIGSVHAEVTVPNEVPIEKVKWEASDVSSWSNEHGYNDIRFRLRVKLTIADPVGENYYKFSSRIEMSDLEQDDELDSGQSLSIGVSDLQYDMEPIFSEHIGIFESIMGGDAYGFTFFTDRQFSEKAYTLNLQFNNCWFRGSLDDLLDCDFILVIHSISPSYYNWVNYVWQRDNGTLTEFGDYGFGEPIWGYSNCTSGAGVVAAQSKNEYHIDLTDFIKETIITHNDDNQ